MNRVEALEEEKKKLLIKLEECQVNLSRKIEEAEMIRAENRIKVSDLEKELEQVVKQGHDQVQKVIDDKQSIEHLYIQATVMYTPKNLA